MWWYEWAIKPISSIIFDNNRDINAFYLACTCPSSPPVVVYVSSDLGSATAQWVAPVPSCSATLKDIQPNKPSGSSFGFGSHTVNYVYSTVAGFDLTCGIDIDVRSKFHRDCLCLDEKKLAYHVKPVFHLANLFAQTSKKRMWLAGDVVSVCRQPIKLLLSLFLRKNSPSGRLKSCCLLNNPA